MKQGWDYKKIGECFSYIKNGANIKQDRNASGIPITRIETLSNGVFNRDRLGYANIFDVNKYSSYILEDTDILMSHINSKQYIGRAVEYRKEGDETIIHGMNLLRLIANKELIIPSFISYYFSGNKFKSDIVKIRKDAVNQSSFAISDLKEILIPVISIEKQRLITSELDQIKNVISKKKSQLFELDNLARSIFFEMFGDPFINERGWETKTIGSVCFEKKHIERANKYYNSTDEINYIDISSIDNKSNIISTTNRFVFCEAPSRAQQIVKNGDILISTVRPNLKNIAIVNVDVEDIVASSGFCVLRPKNIELSFLLNVLLSQSFTESLLTRVTGANYPAVREDDIKTIKIGIPPFSLQHTFAEKIEAIEAMKAKIRQSLEEVEKLFNARMDYYFN